MSILELVKKYQEAKIFEKGEEKGEAKGMEKGMAKGKEEERLVLQKISELLKVGKTDEYILQELDTSIEQINFVKNIMEIK